MRVRALVLAGVAALVLVACGEESDQVFDEEDYPFTFEYPEDFEETDDVEIAQPVGAQAARNVAVGIDDQDLINVQRFTLQVEVTQANLPAVSREVDDLLRQIDPQVERATAGEVGGFLALTVDDLAVGSVEGGLSDMTFLFEGNQEYLINCQSTPAHREEMTDACELALETLTAK